MPRLHLCLVLAVAAASPALAEQQKASSATQESPAQQAPAAAPLVIAPQVQSNQLVLPANTEIILKMNETLDSRRNREGDTFYLSVAQDVLSQGHVIIPRGARGVGEITWLTGKGAFGKSGKMDIELRYVEVGNQRVPINGKYSQRGEGNTTATVATAIAVGVFSAFVTGKSAIIPKERELTAHTQLDLPVVLQGSTSVQPATAVVAVPAANSEPAAQSGAGAPASK